MPYRIRFSKKHVFVRNFLTKSAPYLFSGPNWLHGAFGGKIVPDENFAQFCLKSPLKFVFPKNSFSVWIFVLNRISPYLLAKQTRCRDCRQKWPGAKFRPSQNTRFWMEFFNETGPISLSGPNWRYGAFGGKIVPVKNFAQFCLKWPIEFVFPKNTFLVGIFWQNRPHTSFLGLIGYMVRSGANSFRTKSLLNFASEALSNSFFQKKRFWFEFL